MPCRREYEVQLARLKARALHAQGDLEGALKTCDQARYSLSPDGVDDFAEFEVPWLIEAGRFEDAGRLAFFHIYQSEVSMRPAMARAVHERLAVHQEKSFWWPACLLRASTNNTTLRRLVSLAPLPFERVVEVSPTHELLFAGLGGIPENQRYAPTQGEIDGDEEILDSPEWMKARDAILLASRKLCEQVSPGNPWINRITAHEDFGTGRIDANTKAQRLLQSIEAGKMQDNRSANTAFFAIVDQKGILQALRQPIPVLPSGLWCYNFVCDSTEVISELIDKLQGQEQEEAWALHQEQKKTIYEHGIQCMEGYFKTGSGHTYDSGAHLYSMMCNNLAGVYHSYGRYEEARDLHQRGIEASPFAEHYDGIFMDWWAQENDEKIVSAAEDLWQYAAAFGFGRHNPNKYVPAVAKALGHLDRHDEKTIWLERLMQWQREAGENEGALSEDALSARVEISVSLGMYYPNEARAIWQGIENQVRASQDAELILNSASAAYNREDYELAIELYGESIKCNPRETDIDLNNYTFAKETMEKAKQKLKESGKPQKRGWQFWK